MNEKPTRWDYITTAIIAVLSACWAVYDYKTGTGKIPFEPLIAFATGAFAIWGYSRWRKSKADSSPTSTQMAEKIYNIGEVRDVKFGTNIKESENVVAGSKIRAKNVDIGNKTIAQQTNIKTQIIQYPDGKEIPRYLTNPPFQAEYFIGREKDLQAIEDEYQQHNRPLVLVNGEGGIGKTTLAAKYWYAHETRYKHLAWLFTDGGIGAALLTLAPKLQVAFDANDDEKTQLSRMAEAMNNMDKPWLLVLDNANDVADLNRHYAILHQLADCHILITSRTRRSDMATYEVKPLDQDEAMRLFRHYYPQLADAELPLLHDILLAVGYNTLVTELLAKNLAVFNKYSVQYSLEDLLKELQVKGLLALKNKTVKVLYGSDSLRTEAPKDIIAAMYDLAQLDDSERYLLSNLAVLPAENISYTLLSPLLGVANGDLDDALSSLEEKGWLEYREADNSFKISPVIQEVTRHKNADRLLNDCRTLMETLTAILGDADRTHRDKHAFASTCARLGEAVVYAMPTPDVNLSYLCQNIGNFYQDTGNLPQMMAAYQKMLGIQTDLCQIESENTHFKNGLAISYEKLGSTQTALGNLPQALTFFEDETKLFKELHAAYPQNVDFKNGLAISYSKLGETHTALGNLPQALTFFEQYNQFMKELHAAYPQNVDFKNGLAISYEKLGSTHTALGNLPQALTFFEKDIELSKELHAAYPQNVDFKNGLAISYSKLGETHTALGNLPQALTFFEERSRLGKELHAAYPQNVAFKNGLAISYSKLGETHTALGNLPQALTFFEERSRLGKELHAAYPQNVAFKNGLAISYSKLGWFYRDKMNDVAKAKPYFQQCHDIWKELAEQYPAYQEFRDNYEWVKEQLGY